MKRVASMLITSAALFGLVGAAAAAAGPGYGPDDPSRITNMKRSDKTTKHKTHKHRSQKKSTTGSGTGGYTPANSMTPGSTGTTGAGTGTGTGGVGSNGVDVGTGGAAGGGH